MSGQYIEDKPLGLIIPPLTDAFERLSKLSSRERADVRLLELLVAKDPTAVAHLLHLVDDDVYHHPWPGPTSGLSQIMQKMGHQQVLAELQTLWHNEELHASETLKQLRLKMAEHVYAICVTLQRIRPLLMLSADMTYMESLMAVLVANVAQASLLSSKESDHDLSAKMVAHLGGKTPHLFHFNHELRPALKRGLVLADAWGISPLVRGVLSELALEKRQTWNCSELSQAILLAELINQGAFCEDHHDVDHLMEEAFETSTLLKRLVYKRIKLTHLRIVR